MTLSRVRSGGSGGPGRSETLTDPTYPTHLTHPTLMGASVVVGFLIVTAAACSKGPALQPIATVEQIMETTVEPVSNAVFDAAVWENGVQVGGPKNDDDWKMVQANALMLAETTNLLLMNGRAKDQFGWPIRTQALRDAAMKAANAAGAHNTQAIFDAGTEIYQACTGCHLQYIPNLNAPPADSRGSRGPEGAQASRRPHGS